MPEGVWALQLSVQVWPWSIDVRGEALVVVVVRGLAFLL